MHGLMRNRASSSIRSWGRMVLTTFLLSACGGGSDSANTPATPTTPPAPAKVATVEVAPASASLVVGATQQLAATPKDASGNALTGRTTSWTSSASTIASISAAGLVTAVAPGSATMTATIDGVTGTAAVTVTPVPVASVTLSPTTISVVAGASITLTAETRDASGTALPGRSISWSTSAPAVATVSATGVVTGVAAGSATITATSEGKSATATVTVTPIPVASVTVTPGSGTLYIGGSLTLVATARDAAGGSLAGRAVTWSTSAPTVATVSATGVVAGVAAGSATITATIEGKSATATLTVQPVPVATVSIAPATVALEPGGTQQLTASARDSAGSSLTGRPVTWSTGASSVATISTQGVVTAVGPGTTSATALVEGKSASVTVTVTQAAVATVTLSLASGAVFVDSTLQLSVTVRDARGAALEGRPVTWSSSASTVASVSSSGKVTGLGPGTAIITATSEGKSATATITVSYRLTFRMYESTSLSGPWTTRDVVVAGTDALQLVDPSPVLMPDGTILLYYLMNYFREGDPAAAQPNNQWKMGVAVSTDDGLSFTHRGAALTTNVAITDPFPMVLTDGRIRMLYAQTTGSTSYVYSVTSADATGLTFPYTADAGARSTGASIPGALRIGSTFYLYTCEAGIMWASSTDGLTFGPRSTAIAGSPTTGILCDPSPIQVAANSYAMAYKTRPPGVQNPRSDSTYIATSTNGTTWTRLPTVVGTGSVPGLVRDRNGVFRVYVVYFPPR